MHDPLIDVTDFLLRGEQLVFEQGCTKAAPGVVELYERLIREEYKEWSDAVEIGDEAHILNEAMDIVWVVLGYCIAKRYKTFDAWAALTAANLKKLQIDPTTGKLLRRADGKIQKPEGWKPADFSPFVGTVQQEGKVTDGR